MDYNARVKTPIITNRRESTECSRQAGEEGGRKRKAEGNETDRKCLCKLGTRVPPSRMTTAPRRKGTGLCSSKQTF